MSPNTDSNWRPGIPSPDLNNPEHRQMLDEEAKRNPVDHEDLASSPTITRGMTIGGHFHPDSVKRLADGTAHLHDVMRHVDTHSVGDYWHGHHNSLEDAKIYAEGEHEHHPVHELGEEQYEDRRNPGNFGHPGQINVVLEAHRPKGWDPNKNPDSGVMGNSYLAHPTTLKLHKVHFQSPDGNWHGIDATGHTVHAEGEARGETEAYGEPYPDYEGADHHRKQAARGPGWRICPSCGGVGDTDEGECQRCDGSGYLGRHEAALVVTAADWNAIRAEHQSVHRGFGMELSEDDHDIVHDTSEPTHLRAQHLLALAQGGHGRGFTREPGMGRHWTTDANVAHHFAKQDARERQKHDWSRDGEVHGYNSDGEERYRPETRVVLHAHFPEHEHIDEDGGRSAGAFDYDEPNDIHPVNTPQRYEREVPVAKGTPMRVHAISWGLASHHTDDEAPHDFETHRYDFPEPEHRTAAKSRTYPPRDHRNGGVPFKRIFGPTHGLDVRLFDHDVLKAPIRDDLMRKWHEFCDAQGFYDADDWSIVYFAGSEASEWTSAERKGNNDFDVLVGVSLPLFLAGPYGNANKRRASFLGWPLTPEGVAAGLTEKLRSTPGMVKTDYRLPGDLDDGSDFDQTWYVNPGSYHIADIKPYAAYDVTHDRWAVKPPHLPGWSMKSFPEGPALEDYCWGIEEMARATLDMPEPYRHQEGFALWHFVHDTRSGAFGPQGEGWYDPRNVVEKWLDQKGLMQHLWTLMREAVDDPHLLDSPADWSNTPVMAMLVHSALLVG